MLARMWKNWDRPSHTAGGIQDDTATVETVWLPLAVQNIEFPYDPAIPLLGTYPHRIKIRCPHKHLYGNVHNHSLTQVSERKQPRCQSTDESINTMVHVHVMEYRPARKEQSEPTLFYLYRSRRYLNEVSQSQGTTHCIVLPTHGQNGQNPTESRSVVGSSFGKGGLADNS